MMKFLALAFLFVCLMGVRADVQQTLEVTIENTAPVWGTIITPTTFFLHDGGDEWATFAVGGNATDYVGLEQYAEDGNAAPFIASLESRLTNGVSPVTSGSGVHVIQPTVSVKATFTGLSPSDQGTRYLSFLAMLLPTNDAFISNAEPTAIDTWSPGCVDVTQAWDAGTEANNEEGIPLFSPTWPSTNTQEPISTFSGFQDRSLGSHAVLNDPRFCQIDLTKPIARVCWKRHVTSKHVVNLDFSGVTLCSKA